MVTEHLDLSNVFVGGHSFGAATAIQSAWTQPKAFKATVLLDAWTLPIERPLVEHGIGHEIPVYHLISEEFLKWQENMDEVRTLHQGCTHAHSQLLVLNRSAHSSFSDVAVFFHRLLNEYTGTSGPLDPHEALCTIRWGVIQYLKAHLDQHHPQSITHHTNAYFEHPDIAQVPYNN